jgi:hypothetical protein
VGFSTVRPSLRALVINDIAYATGFVWLPLSLKCHCIFDPDDPSMPNAFHDAQIYSWEPTSCSMAEFLALGLLRFPLFFPPLALAGAKM